MNSLLDKILVKPLFRGWVFVRKHPFLTVVLAVFLFLLPPLGVTVYAFGVRLAGFVGRVLGKELGERFESFVGSVLVKVADSSTGNNSLWALALPAAGTLLFPPLGVLLSFWLLVDLFKGDRFAITTSQVATPPATAVPTETSTTIAASDFEDEFTQTSLTV